MSSSKKARSLEKLKREEKRETIHGMSQEDRAAALAMMHLKERSRVLEESSGAECLDGSVYGPVYGSV